MESPKPQQDRQHKALERERRVILKKHAVGVFGLRLEQYLELSSDPHVEEFMKDNNLNGISEEVLVNTRKIIEEYRKKKVEVQSDTAMIFRELAIHPNESDETIGQVLFHAITKEQPKGVVRCYRKGHLMAFACASPEDLKTLYNRRGNKHEVAPAGFFSENMAIVLPNGKKARLPVMVIGDSPGADNADIQSTVQHEWKHFVHNRMNDFLFYEPTFYGALQQNPAQGEYPRKKISMRGKVTYSKAVGVAKGLLEGSLWSSLGLNGLKDEVLAFFVDGESAGRISEIAQYISYQHHVKKLKSAEQEYIRPLLVEIQKLFLDIIPMLPTYEHRAVIANELIDVPLPEMPKWLRAIGHTYRGVYDTVNTSVGARSLDKQQQYPQELQDQTDKLVRTIWDEAFFSFDITKQMKMALEKNKNKIEHLRTQQQFSPCIVYTEDLPVLKDKKAEWVFSERMARIMELAKTYHPDRIATVISAYHEKNHAQLFDFQNQLVTDLSHTLHASEGLWIGYNNIGDVSVLDDRLVLPLFLPLNPFDHRHFKITVIFAKPQQ